METRRIHITKVDQDCRRQPKINQCQRNVFARHSYQIHTNIYVLMLRSKYFLTNYKMFLWLFSVAHVVSTTNEGLEEDDQSEEGKDEKLRCLIRIVTLLQSDMLRTIEYHDKIYLE
jgi:hypothetical protein